LTDALMNVEKAFNQFFKGCAKFPAFKKHRDGRHSFENCSGNSIDNDIAKLYIPKFSEGISFQDTRKIEGTLKKVTVSRSANGHYYAAIRVEIIDENRPSEPSSESRAIGLDFGLTHLVITSEGDKIANPKTLQRYYRRFQLLHRRMKRKTKGSRNREKARIELAALYAKITAVRNHCLHEITNQLIERDDVDTFCLEDLRVKKMRRENHLNWSIQDAGWGILRRHLTYKAEWRGKNVRVISQFAPSTQTCSSCGDVNRHLKLIDREWICRCGAHHDRDINAAINIKKMAFANDFVSNDEIPKDIRESTPVEQSAAMNQECSVT
jgi:putative transposase